MIVVWSENAKNNLLNYKQNSQIIAESKIDDYINSLIDYVEGLSDFRKLGKFLFYKNNCEVRQLIYHMHRIFYTIDDNNVYVLLVSHVSRNMDTILKELKDKNFELF